MLNNVGGYQRVFLQHGYVKNIVQAARVGGLYARAPILKDLEGTYENGA